MVGADTFPSATGAVSFLFGEYGNPQKTPFTTQVLPNRWWDRKRGSFATQTLVWLQKRLELFFVANSPEKLQSSVTTKIGCIVTELNCTVRYSIGTVWYWCGTARKGRSVASLPSLVSLVSLGSCG